MKIAELRLTPEWVDLFELVPRLAGNKVELYNAATNTSEICYTENADKPIDTTFYKVLKAQTGVTMTIGKQPIWVKSEYNVAKLMVSELEG